MKESKIPLSSSDRANFNRVYGSRWPIDTRLTTAVKLHLACQQRYSNCNAWWQFIAVCLIWKIMESGKTVLRDGFFISPNLVQVACCQKHQGLHSIQRQAPSRSSRGGEPTVERCNGRCWSFFVYTFCTICENNKNIRNGYPCKFPGSYSSSASPGFVSSTVFAVSPQFRFACRCSVELSTTQRAWRAAKAALHPGPDFNAAKLLVLAVKSLNKIGIKSTKSVTKCLQVDVTLITDFETSSSLVRPQLRHQNPIDLDMWSVKFI